MNETEKFILVDILNVVSHIRRTSHEIPEQKLNDYQNTIYSKMKALMLLAEYDALKEV